MKTLLFVTAMAAACASAHGPKAPDESHRVPVNQVVPPEAAPDGGPEQAKARKARRDPREVEWR